MKKSESPHTLEADVTIASTTIKGRCSCVAGAGGFCHHVIALLFYIAHCKQSGLMAIPDDLTCTSLPQRWSVPRERKIANKSIQELWVKKPQQGANYSKFIKSTLFSPAALYPIMTYEHLSDLDPKPLMATLAPKREEVHRSEMVPCKFGNVPKASVLSYQQKLSQEYVINDFSCPLFPSLSLDNAKDRIKNNVMICLTNEKQAALESLQLTQEKAIELEHATLSQSDSQLWYSLRAKRITASKFGDVAKRQSGFENLVKQLNPTRRVVTGDMQRGIDMEPFAAIAYANIAKKGKVNLFPSGLIINPVCPWLGCTPDHKVYDMEAEEEGLMPFGLLEVKVVKEGSVDFSKVQYLSTNADNQLKLKESHKYYYQVQCQLALSGLEWCDFFTYISDSLYHCERILFDQNFFEKAKDKVDLFFFNFYLN